MKNMNAEKQPEQQQNEFDFFKTNPIVQQYKKTKAKFRPKKTFYSAPKGLWGLLIAALGLFGLYHNIEHAGWILFLAFLKLDNNKDGLLAFGLAALALLGLYHNVEYSGWLIFAAFIL